MVASTRTNSKIIYPRSSPFDKLIQCILTPKVLAVGNIHQKILKTIFHQVIFSNLIVRRFELVYPSSIQYVPDLKKNLPILIEINKNHQIMLPRGRIGFSSLDVVDRQETKYQIRSPFELTNAIIATDERYNDCFFLQSTIPAQCGDEFLQIVYGNENSIIQQPNSVGHCISVDANMSKGFADFFSQKIPGIRPTCKKSKTPN